MPPNGGCITHYLHHSIMAPEAERGVLIPLDELNAAAAVADDGNHLVLGCFRVVLPEGNHWSEAGEWPMHSSYSSLAPELFLHGLCSQGTGDTMKSDEPAPHHRPTLSTIPPACLWHQGCFICLLCHVKCCFQIFSHLSETLLKLI